MPRAQLTYKCTATSIRGGLFHYLQAVPSRAKILTAVEPGRLSETAMEGAHEAGMVFIADGAGDFVDRRFARAQQTRRLLQPVLADQIAHTQAGLLFE